MPGPSTWMKTAVKAVRSGQVSEAVIDDKVRRVLHTLRKAGRFEQLELQPEQAIDRPEHRRLARQAAAEAIVLLKNQAGALPLKAGQLKSIAVIGSNARWAQVMGGGSATVTPHYVTSPLDGIRQRAGEGVEVRYSLGCPTHQMLPLLDPALLRDENGQQGFKVELFDNLDFSGQPTSVKFIDRANIDWVDRLLVEVTPGRFSTRLSATFTAPGNGRYGFSLAGHGVSRLLLDGLVLVDCWSDRTPDFASWPVIEKSAEIDLQAGLAYRLEVEYALESFAHWRLLRIGCLTPQPADPIQDAVDLAAISDVAIVFAGLTSEWESEGFDRPDLELCGAQVELIERVAAVNPNTIVVLNTGSPIVMPWLDKVPATLQAWYSGQEAGNAIADVVFGDVCPSGRLPQTFPARLQDNPAYLNYPGENGQVLYGEGLFVGYRYYDKKDIAPLFPFGYGLSYTTFAHHSLALSAPTYRPGEPVEVSLEVENTGPCAGQEVVQLYIRDLKSRLVRPEQELKAFAKLALAPGEHQTVRFSLDERALTYYDPASKDWVAEPGLFEVRIGSSSRPTQSDQITRFELLPL